MAPNGEKKKEKKNLKKKGKEGFLMADSF